VPDVFTKAKRSQVMSRIRGRGNKDTELRLIALMRAHGITGWRRSSKLTGKPDFVFPRLKLAVFVDGCFWHGCPKHATQPKNNAAFWRKKIAANQARDRRVNRTLRARGWKVIRVWEHELTRRNERKLIRRLAAYLPPSREASARQGEHELTRKNERRLLSRLHRSSAEDGAGNRRAWRPAFGGRPRVKGPRAGSVGGPHGERTGGRFRPSPGGSRCPRSC